MREEGRLVSGGFNWSTAYGSLRDGFSRAEGFLGSKFLSCPPTSGHKPLWSTETIERSARQRNELKRLIYSDSGEGKAGRKKGRATRKVRRLSCPLSHGDQRLFRRRQRWRRALCPNTQVQHESLASPSVARSVFSQNLCKRDPF